MQELHLSKVSAGMGFEGWGWYRGLLPQEQSFRKGLLIPSMCKALWGYKYQKLVAPLQLSKVELDQVAQVP